MMQRTPAGSVTDKGTGLTASAGRRGLAIHAALVTVVLLTCLFLPRPGQAIVLVPLAPSARLPLRTELSAGSLALLGQGRIAGTWLVRASGPVPFETLLAHHFLPLAAPSLLCGADTAVTPSDFPRGNHG